MQLRSMCAHGAKQSQSTACTQVSGMPCLRGNVDGPACAHGGPLLLMHPALLWAVPVAQGDYHTLLMKLASQIEISWAKRRKDRAGVALTLYACLQTPRPFRRSAGAYTEAFNDNTLNADKLAVPTHPRAPLQLYRFSARGHLFLGPKIPDPCSQRPQGAHCDGRPSPPRNKSQHPLLSLQSSSAMCKGS